MNLEGECGYDEDIIEQVNYGTCKGLKTRSIRKTNRLNPPRCSFLPKEGKEYQDFKYKNVSSLAKFSKNLTTAHLFPVNSPHQQ